MDSNIIQKINNLLIEEFEVEAGSITPDASLKEVLDLDSLDYIDLIAITESNFGCKVKPEDFNSIATFQDFYNYIDAHTKVKELI
jgi:acyl carrier protein